jgi:hypothetical protein
MSDDKSILQTPIPDPKPSAATAPATPEQPPPGMLDMDKVRYWAGRGPHARRNRPAYSIMGNSDD